MTERNIDIRVAGADDAAILSAIGTTSFRAAYGSTASASDLLLHLEDFFGVEAVRAELARAGRTYLLASVDECAAGFAKIRDSQVPAAIPAQVALELQQVYVLPEYQRDGIGGCLIAATVNYARERSADGLWLSVWEEAPWAIGAYTKHGFQPVGETEFKLGNTVYSDLLMWRPNE